jgi:hypothetical protein
MSNERAQMCWKSKEYLCFVILLLYVCSSHFILCQTCIKIHFYCVDLLFIFLSLTVEMKLMRSRCSYRISLPFAYDTTSISKLAPTHKLVTDGERSKFAAWNLFAETTNKSPKLWLIILFGGSSQTRNAWSAQDTNRKLCASQRQSGRIFVSLSFR